MTNYTPEMPESDTLGVVGLASTYDAGTLIASHSHTAHQIVHAISGTMRVTVQNKVWFVPPARALWIPAKTMHAIQCVGPVEMRTAYLSKACPSAHPDVLVVSVSSLMREILIRLTERDGTALKLLLADVLLLEMRQSIREPFSLPIPSDPRIARLALHLQNTPADGTPLNVWAKRLGFSERNLIRQIRTQTGMTFRELRRLTRIMIALDKLSAGQSVTTTAFDVGFETPSAFIHAFKSLTGKTPRQFMSGN
ncbi:AraC family transcriptional regulator [Candidatus Halocynthiibacter alkanivorans]|uniref:AraC family transcriptional regulator n=1 Tax=Candidatus Halocynthiibacter alkanivorans TaxID=2267619 RepID=UPI000DF2A265|nr:helix-turn-helix domain-containing protein [Candidatus Halocynthiibacter alkanivorans]